VPSCDCTDPSPGEQVNRTPHQEGPGPHEIPKSLVTVYELALISREDRGRERRSWFPNFDVGPPD
jgi:hypothetical protein